MKDSVDIELSGKKTVPNYFSIAVGVFVTVAAIVVGPLSVWAGTAIGLLGLIMSRLYPATSTMREIVKVHSGG